MGHFQGPLSVCTFIQFSSFLCMSRKVSVSFHWIIPGEIRSSYFKIMIDRFSSQSLSLSSDLMLWGRLYQLTSSFPKPPSGMSSRRLFDILCLLLNVFPLLSTIMIFCPSASKDIIDLPPFTSQLYASLSVMLFLSFLCKVQELPHCYCPQG